MPKPDILDLSARDLRTGMRQFTKADFRQYRSILRELRTQPSDVLPLLTNRIDYAYRVGFATGQKEQLDYVHHIVTRHHDRAHWIEPWLNALGYSGRFETYLPEAQSFAAENPNLPAAFLHLVQAQMLTGDVPAGVQAARDGLSVIREQKSQVPQILKFFLQTLCQAGEAKWLLKNFPGFSRSEPDIKLATQLAPLPDQPVPLYCINMDRDVARLRRAKAMLSTGTTFHRSPGVSGSSLPSCVLKATGFEINVPRRAQVGCHMGHMRAWESIADLEEGQFGLVVEDDAVFTFGPGRGLSEAMQAAQAHDLDLLFINVEPVSYIGAARKPEDICVHSVDDVLFGARTSHRFSGWGGEGYLLTPAGARKLIDFSMSLGILAPLDWQIALYSAKEFDLSEISYRNRNVLPERLAALRAKDAARYTINSGVLNLPVLRQSDLGYKAHIVEVSLQNQRKAAS